MRPSMMIEPRSVMWPKTGRTWETLSAQATGPTSRIHRQLIDDVAWRCSIEF